MIIQPYSPEESINRLFLTEKLREIFFLEIKWNNPVPVPKESYDRGRGQFLGSYFLRDLLRFKEDRSIVLGIVSHDLYEPDLNFIFGIASYYTKTAVISTYRLHNRFYGFQENFDVFMDRVVKESVHEIGHTLGLGHCDNPQCVMYFSNSIVDTDRKSYYFCSRCYTKVKKAIGL
ncbi:archaemetzincin family Zn-dependent metalloprotease [Persephonella atlantica]|uniref:Archaemetzincin family Zn-dependent metalloprotease n=1 Tax=Persephonella atlantica TaxID=2699429 RepID=A0ABS1GJ82_9AQUI|nr:archaemetzincin family Zn-dependent metalloprotease [Persephonella atlantica]